MQQQKYLENFSKKIYWKHEFMKHFYKKKKLFENLLKRTIYFLSCFMENYATKKFAQTYFMKICF